jgi:hypothetical protein
MKYFRIDKTNEIKPTGIQNIGRPASQRRERYKDLNNWAIRFFVNHGNHLAHTLDLVHNQLNILGDRKVYEEDGRSINLHTSRGLCFCSSSCFLYTMSNRGKENVITINGQPYALYTTPALYIYDKALIDNLVKEDKADWYPDEIPSYKHRKGDKTYEYRVRHAIDLPAPKYIVIGKNYFGLVKENRWELKEYLNMVKTYFPKVTILHLPEIRLGATKEPDATGNNMAPLSGLRLLEALYHIETKKYKQTYIKGISDWQTLFGLNASRVPYEILNKF